MSFSELALPALGRVGTVAAIAAAFIFGLAGTVYLSLRTSEVRVPDIVGRDRGSAESALAKAGLKIRVRAQRFSSAVPAETILVQLPKAGEVVKVGQTVAVDVSRASARAGESSTAPVTASSEDQKPPESEQKQEATTANLGGNQNRGERRPRNTNNSNNTNKANTRNSNNTNRSANANNRNAPERNANLRNTNTPPERVTANNANSRANANRGNLNLTAPNANRRNPTNRNRN